MSQPSLEGLLKLFEFEKKSELERYCRTVQISGKDFANLIIACDIHAIPFLHEIFYRDIVPRHLELSDSDIQALHNNKPGPLTPGGAKAVSKMFQMFEERKYLVGHIFYTPNFSRWHFFCFDQRDLEEDKPNHWKEGAHVHFVNWLWPGQDAKSAWLRFVNENGRPGGSIHLRFSSPK
jgi:hypothetical protein